MKPTLLRAVAAPSPSVLSFLRAQVKNVFDLPAGRCVALAHRQCAYTTVAREGAHTTSPVEQRLGNTESMGLPATRTVASRSRRINTRTSQPTSDASCLPRRTLCSSYSSTFAAFLVSRRAFSTSRQHNVWDVFKSAHNRAPTQQVDESVGPTGFGSSLGRISRPANELKMRCTELDEHGNVTLVSGEFKKSELIAKYGLLPRDLRKIDSSLLPHILVRPSAILINLLNLRVLLKHNRVLVFDAYGTTDSKSQSVFMYDLDLKLRQKESPANGTLAYEFRALEAVLISVTLSLEKEFEGVSEPVVRVLRELEEDIDRDKLRYLLIYSKKLGSFEQKARLVRNALEELLEADDDLSAMYLTEKAEGRERDDEDHTEVEMLLESYHKVADEIVQAAENLVSSIRNTEEMYVSNSSHFPLIVTPY
jgi:magnesium transporter